MDILSILLIEMSQQYQVLIAKSLGKFADLLRRRDDIDAELMKMRQFIHAAINMLPDDEAQTRATFRSQFDSLVNQMGSGLTDAVRDALKFARSPQGTRGGWVTAAEVRDHLVKAGFDFSGYKSNPLASVNTVLSRMKPEEVETSVIGGTTVYRFKPKTVRWRPE